ncbi:MAG: hypothetical protein R2909_04780 [Gemmatimonadales bacterium]
MQPNPLVGALVLGPDGVLGEGFHAEYGGPHAEAVALAAAGERARAPRCSSPRAVQPPGKQPACVDRILASGVSRVVIAAADPHAVAAGGRAVRQAGVAVEIGARATDALPTRTPPSTRRWSGAGGRFSPSSWPPPSTFGSRTRGGHSRWISGEQARDFVHSVLGRI